MARTTKADLEKQVQGLQRREGLFFSVASLLAKGAKPDATFGGRIDGEPVTIRAYGLAASHGGVLVMEVDGYFHFHYLDEFYRIQREQLEHGVGDDYTFVHAAERFMHVRRELTCPAI
jgi:hypothetical protein